MQLSHSDVEVETIHSRLERGDIDLQPDFQRGDVWPKSKKVKLIDSIFRGWKIPPVHVIIHPISGVWQVLDGQQRLTAIRDFLEGDFKFDGEIHPIEDNFVKIDGLYFDKLPDHWRRKFLSYDIRFIKLSEYQPEEPAELFFRLNQPVSLTAAEQRNAFYGETRDQVKTLSLYLDRKMNGKEGIGFSNSRLAYDDVIARLLFFIKGDAFENFSNEKIVEIYRNSNGFDLETIEVAKLSIDKLSDAKGSEDRLAKFTKATLLSWLIFISRKSDLNIDALTLSISDLESNRIRKPIEWSAQRSRMAEIYNESVSFRVNEQNSIIKRDIVIYWFYTEFLEDISDMESKMRKLAEEMLMARDRLDLVDYMNKWIANYERY